MDKKEVRYRFVFENEDQLNQNLSKIKEIHGLVVETRKEIEQLNSKLEKIKELPRALTSISEMPLLGNVTVKKYSEIIRDVDAGKITVNQAREALGLPKNNDNGLSDQFLIKLEKSCNETEEAQKESP